MKPIDSVHWILAGVMVSACAAEPVATSEGSADLDEEIARAAAELPAAAPGVADRERPTPGAPGIGDPLYPTLGNGGYEVDHYALDLRYETADPTQPLVGTVKILAHATQSLSQFDLDFAGDSIGEVRVDGRAAEVRRDGEDLVITPARPIRNGDRFVVTVADFTATPQVPIAVAFNAPFFSTPDGSGWALQSNNAHRVFPCNDHPSDKATFSFRIDVPEGTTAVANGVQTSVRTAHGRTIYRFRQHEPMATELAQVAVGAYTVIERGRHDDVLLRDVVPTRLVADLAPKLAAVTAQLDFMENLVGAYPFPDYGSFVVDAQLGFALETQTLTVFDGSIFTQPTVEIESVMTHELAHQWFGDSVSPHRWSDVWQNEGHAVWYEFSRDFVVDSDEFTALMKLLYADGDLFRGLFGPVAVPPSGEILALFNPNVNCGGALALFALRQQIGDPAFRAVERAWVTEFRGRSPSTEDFIALASRVSGQDLDAFLHSWLFGTKTPAMPGHPDWTVTPFTPAAPGPTAAAVLDVARTGGGAYRIAQVLGIAPPGARK
jgi:aminopeptidase N